MLDHFPQIGCWMILLLGMVVVVVGLAAVVFVPGFAVFLVAQSCGFQKSLKGCFLFSNGTVAFCFGLGQRCSTKLSLPLVLQRLVECRCCQNRASGGQKGGHAILFLLILELILPWVLPRVTRWILQQKRIHSFHGKNQFVPKVMALVHVFNGTSKEGRVIQEKVRQYFVFRLANHRPFGHDRFGLVVVLASNEDTVFGGWSCSLWIMLLMRMIFFLFSLFLDKVERREDGCGGTLSWILAVPSNSNASNAPSAAATRAAASKAGIVLIFW